MAKAAGIREVAEAAGVSIGTVSNVVNRPELVSAQMLARVQATMAQLGFVRNDLARQMKMGGGTTLGAIVLNIGNPFFADLAHALELAAEERGYISVLASSNQSPERENRYIDLFEGQRVEGMIVAPIAGITERIHRLHRSGMPFVLFGYPSDEVSDFCTVEMDGDVGAYRGIEHLIACGRRDLAFVGGPRRQVRDRWQGALRGAAENGVRLRTLETTDQTMQEGARLGDHIASLPPEERPDGIFAANDLLAMGIMQSLLLARDISIPGDIALMGYDDVSYAPHLSVALTTMRQDVDQMARAAVDLLLTEREEGVQHEHRRVVLTPDLVLRDSTGPLA